MNPIEILYPNRCIGCDEVLGIKNKTMGICKKCRPNIEIVGDVVCVRCGKPLTDETKAYCADCTDRLSDFKQGRGVFKYTKAMKLSMYRFKYSNRRCYAKVYAKIAAKKYGLWIRNTGIDVIIPIPMYKYKEMRRGYNQAKVFARELSKITGIPIREDLVFRQKNTKPLKTLNPTQRRKNLKNAFIFGKNSVQYENALLVDDIYTTGSTMEEVSKVIRRAGIKNIYGMYICVGKGSF